MGVMIVTEYKVILKFKEILTLYTLYLLELVLVSGAKSITVEFVHTSLAIKHFKKFPGGATGSQAIKVLLSILLMLLIVILTAVRFFKLK